LHRSQVQRLAAGIIIALGAANVVLGIALLSYADCPSNPTLDVLALLVAGLLVAMAGVLAIWSFRIAMTLGGSLAVALAICGLFFWHNLSLPTAAFGAIGITGVVMLLLGEHEKQRNPIMPLTRDDTNSAPPHLALVRWRDERAGWVGCWNREFER